MNWKDLANSAMKTGLNAFTGGLAGEALGLLGGLFGNKQPNQEALQRQAWEYEKEGMALQYQYGQQAADAQQKRNLQMWEATNYSAQREQMEKAGLNVGLMYGQGGAGGATAAGGQPTQPSGMNMNPVQAKLQAAAMGIQMKQVEAQTRLANAEAMKTNVEAEKISGVDTKLQEATVSNLIEQTKNEKEKRNLIKSEVRLNMANEDLAAVTINYTEAKTNETKGILQKTMRESEALLRQIKSMELDNTVKEKTMQNVIDQQSLQTAQMIKNLTKTNAETDAIRQSINSMVNDMSVKTKGVAIEWERLNNDMVKHFDNLGISEKQLGQNEKKLILEALQGLINLAKIAE